MRRPGDRGWSAAAASVIALTFAAQLALVAWNRSSEMARLELGEAGLVLPWPHLQGQGRPLALDLRVEDATELAADDYARLGFPVDAADERERQHLPRRAWLVIDVSEEAWLRHLERRGREVRHLAADVDRGRGDDFLLGKAREDLERLREGPPRPLVVAAGGDPAELRRRFPDRQLQAVVPGSVTLWTGRGPSWWNHSLALAVDEVTVPPRLQGPVRGLIEAWGQRSAAGNPARRDVPPFRAVVAWGRRGEPWLRTVEARPEPPTTHGAQETHRPLVRSAAPAPRPDLGAGEPP